MIMLLVLTLSTGVTTDTGWISGTYGWKAFSYPTIAACASARTNVIAYANSQKDRTLVSQCGTVNDVAEFRFYEAPASTPPVPNENPPSKPTWEKMS